ncbi:hypothetical protein [Clostridium estertheticum]|uniref:Uncharacterized protein n=1 Tax=Clostridium estertheticum subsp. estertheticum TaxID=1552 RepID=A0A1J0GEY3_9CLOT|nr:hypothetical protein [Clostridium estertheticum]APC39932.1 hypothetical protein A7L45_07535 [Clostridium estertheticum subsp. estertheticum]MBZ9614003.1 hypothetical protein [Clostridium estertheticum subsp. laramiense]WAG73959.1 hypothetical protein LL032_00410 [Clostridium estertheticum]
MLDFVDFKILIPLMLICTGSQQLFIGLRFYKENKKIKVQHMLCNSGYFVVTIFIILKIYHFV